MHPLNQKFLDLLLVITEGSVLTCVMQVGFDTSQKFKYHLGADPENFGGGMHF